MTGQFFTDVARDSPSERYIRGGQDPGQDKFVVEAGWVGDDGAVNEHPAASS
jgi:hypothetical protein